MTPVERLFAFAFDLAAKLMRGVLEAFGIGLKRALTPIEVERATAADVIDVRHAVLRKGRPRETAVFDGDTRPATRHWVARQADRVVGVASVMQAAQPEGDARWQLRGMAVLDDLQGLGVGRALLDEVARDVVDPMWCNARQRAVPFYERAGWKVVGEPFVIEPIGPHRCMVQTTPG